MPTQHRRWRVLPKYLLRRPDGRWMSYRERIVDFVLMAPRGCRRDNLANACGLLPAELDVIVDRLEAAGKVERNRRLTGGRPVDRIERPRGPEFWGCAAAFKRSTRGGPRSTLMA